VSTVGRIAVKGLIRNPGRTLVRVLVLAAAVGLLGAMVLFIGNSLRTMTASATSAVALDWQGPVGSQSQAVSVAHAVAGQPGVAQASPTATAPVCDRDAGLGGWNDPDRKRLGARSAAELPATHPDIPLSPRARSGRARSCSTSSSPPRCRPASATA